jgi:hypothetical protein
VERAGIVDEIPGEDRSKTGLAMNREAEFPRILRSEPRVLTLNDHA